jgi:hypothetical protein
MSRKLIATAAALVVLAGAVALTAQADPSPPTGLTPAVYAAAVTEICANALLFGGTHQIGTREGALEVAADIRDSSRRRLSQVAAFPAPPGEARAVVQWLALEQRLADTYARNYVRIFDIIAAPSTRRHIARAASLIHALVHATDSLRQSAGLLEQQLGVPDCTGG